MNTLWAIQDQVGTHKTHVSLPEIILYRLELTSETFAQGEPVFVEDLRPLVPGRAFLDVEGGHHIGCRLDGPVNIWVCIGEEA
jgi:hypothetical protein